MRRAPAERETVDALDWPRIEEELDGSGCAVVGPLLTVDECRAIAALYGEDARFRSRVVMSRHGFGRGEYKYFARPLPARVQALREALYPRLAPVANRWNEALREPSRFPTTHGEFLERCRAAGQTRPTPLLLRYGPGDYNCLHQDLYGENVFPLQVAILLSEPGVDFTGGELVLTEQRPRMQSRVEVPHLRRGDGVAFAVNVRPVRGARGSYRVRMRHGSAASAPASASRSGSSFTTRSSGGAPPPYFSSSSIAAARCSSVIR